MIVLLLLIALFQLDVEGLLHSIKQIPLRLVLSLIGLQVLSQILINIQWHQIAKLSGVKASFWDMLYINSQGSIMDSITPGVKIGGEITRAVQISRKAGCSGEQSAVIVALQKLFSISALLSIQLFAAGYLIGRMRLLQAFYMQFLIYGVLVLLILIFATIFFMPNRIKVYLQLKKKPRFSWQGKARSFLVALTDRIIYIHKNWMMLWLLSFIIWLLYPIKIFMLSAQFAPDISIFYIGAIAFAAYMVAMLPIFPGGLGGFEGAMTGLLVLVGLMINDAAVITILFRFATFWFVLLLSLVYIGLYKGVRPREKP